MSFENIVGQARAPDREPNIQAEFAAAEDAWRKYDIPTASERFTDLVHSIEHYFSPQDERLLTPYLRLLEIKVREGDYSTAHKYGAKALSIVGSEPSERKYDFALSIESSLVVVHALLGNRRATFDQEANLQRRITIFQRNLQSPYLLPSIAEAHQRNADAMVILGNYPIAAKHCINAIDTVLSIQRGDITSPQRLLDVATIARNLLRDYSNIGRLNKTPFNLELEQRVEVHVQSLLQDSNEQADWAKHVPGRFQYGRTLSLCERGDYKLAEAQLHKAMQDQTDDNLDASIRLEYFALAAYIKAHRGKLDEASSLLELASRSPVNQSSSSLAEFPNYVRVKRFLGYVNLELARSDIARESRESFQSAADAFLIDDALGHLKRYFRKVAPSIGPLMDKIYNGGELNQEELENKLLALNRSAFRGQLFSLYDTLEMIEKLYELKNESALRVDLTNTQTIKAAVRKILDPSQDYPLFRGVAGIE